MFNRMLFLALKKVKWSKTLLLRFPPLDKTPPPPRQKFPFPPSPINDIWKTLPQILNHVKRKY